MSALLRLYPRAWRARYGDELAALLDAHPPTIGDRLDLLRGALDARMHPQVPEARAERDVSTSAPLRAFGVSAVVGGVAWIAGIASLLILPKDVYGDRDASLAAIALPVGSILIGVALGELGSRAGSAASMRTGHVVSYVTFFVGATLALGWPLFLIGFYGFPIVAWLSVVRGSRNRAFPRWFVAVGGLSAAAMIAGGLGGIQAESGVVLISVPGLVAVVVAWRAARRGSFPTRDVDAA